MKFDKPTTAEVVPDTKETKIEIKYEVLDDNTPSEGYKIGLLGKATTGKTLSALELGHLQKKNIPIFKEMGMKYVPICLENDTIPEIKEIIFIESENIFRSQRSRPIEKMILEGLPPIKFLQVPVVPKKLLKAAAEGKIKNNDFTDKTIKDTDLAYNMYELYLEDTVGTFNPAIQKNDGGKAGRNTLVVIDSASRYRLLIDLKSFIQMKMELQNTTDTEEQRQIRADRWQNRNQWWMYFFSCIRGCPAWVATTFMREDKSDATVDIMEKKKGRDLTADEAVTDVMAPKTDFHMDNIYVLEKDPVDNSVSAKLKSGRYVCRKPENQKTNSFKLDMNGKYAKYAFIWAIENMLTAMAEVEGVSFESRKTE